MRRAMVGVAVVAMVALTGAATAQQPIRYSLFVIEQDLTGVTVV